MSQTAPEPQPRTQAQYDETNDLSRDEKLQKLKHPYTNDGPTKVYPEGRKPWNIDDVDEETGTVTISCNPPRERGVTDEVDVDDVFRCECDQWVVGWCMKCATPYRHDCPVCSGGGTARVVENDHVTYKHKSGRECRVRAVEDAKRRD